MNEFLDQFLLESRELVEQASADLLVLERNPLDKATLDSAFRAFHTLKGGAGIVDFFAMADKMKGYIDPQLNLRPDHTFVMSFAIAPIEGTWKLVKDDVILTPKTIFGMKSEDVQKQAAHAMEKAQSKSPIPLPFLLGGDALAMPKEMRGHMDSKHETMTLDPGEGTFISNFGQITFKKA